MTALEDLIAARATLTAAIAANAGKPNYSKEGQSVSWSVMYDNLAKLNEQIAQLDQLVEVSEFHRTI